MSKVVLHLEEDYDFSLIGISSHTKDYRLCWELNKLFNIDLTRSEDLEITKNKNTSRYSFYMFNDIDNHTDLFLVSNAGDSGFLIPEYKKVDFFYMLKGNIVDYRVDDIISKINQLPLVLTSFAIDVTQLKSKQNLLF